jgi:hypothetical protein
MLIYRESAPQLKKSYENNFCVKFAKLLNYRKNKLLNTWKIQVKNDN